MTLPPPFSTHACSRRSSGGAETGGAGDTGTSPHDKGAKRNAYANILNIMFLPYQTVVLLQVLRTDAVKKLHKQEGNLASL
ncbi:hypothetical protein [Akkermansia sp.]|uniref:hypothetical protein n=1 Tax=Akkermansia sp. TaxID=1872421 RepID=UPI00399595A1